MPNGPFSANVLFATSRQRLPDTTAGIPNFGDTALPADPGALTCAKATVTGIDISKPSSGVITQVSPLNQGGFAAADLTELLASQNDILVFVHGAANDFNDAITRAAYNKSWLGQGSVPGWSSVFDVIAFTWPARQYTLANIIGDYADYRHDQAEATQSAYHFGLFLQQLLALQARIGRRRLNLLCHSMGNYMLGGAVEPLHSMGNSMLGAMLGGAVDLSNANRAQPATPMFDEIVLAAADEPATTFSTPNGGRMSYLWRLGREITVYFNNADVAMGLSQFVNRDYRLGYDGPPNTADTQFFSTNVYEFVDCTGVGDFISPLLQAPDRSHQYYRQSPTVRQDILATLAGATPVRPKYDPNANVYSLFPQAAVVAAAAAAGPDRGAGVAGQA